MLRWGSVALKIMIVVAATAAGQAYAQRADENAVRAADDAFGVSVGNEKIGIYNDRDVRGFSPVAAGNVRLEGLYFDMRGNIPTRLLATTQMRVGLTAQGYPFPAPTGIVDYQFKTLGNKKTYSALAQAGPNEGYSYELDAYLPIDGKRFGIVASGAIRREEPTPGQSVQPISVGAIARWHPTDNISAMAFYGHFDRYGGKTNAQVFTSGAFLPPEVKAQRFSQDWAQSDLAGDSYGIGSHVKLSEHWKLESGVFRYFQLSSGNTSETYLGTDQTGLSTSRRFSRDPQNKLDSYSGETRLTGVFTQKQFRHTLAFSYRAREAMRTFGGSSQAVTGPTQIGVGTKIAEPIFTTGATTRDEISQSNIGAAYSLAWRGVGEIGFGVQQVDYEKTITPPAAAKIVTLDDPLLHNISVALTPTDKLIIYASHTRGLEDANTAPDIAVNASEAPPAIRTVQSDIGIRYAITPKVKLIAGYFQIEKPYFNLDPGNVYRELGKERHSGVELSLAGTFGDKLTVVAGAVLQKPEVTGEAVQTHQIGPRPVAQAETTVKLNFDYRPGWVEGLSVDAGVNYTGEKAASSREFVALGGEQLSTDEFATLDLGMRYRFKAQGHPATLRMQVLNVTDEFAWQVAPSGSFVVSSPRAFQASLAMDF